MRAIITRFLREDVGASAIEYGLLIGLIAAALVAATSDIGARLGNILLFLGSKLTAP
ncbi:hypothetical protein LMG7141_02271 [Ralstonia condita]|jgi:pilus assembly protein Flp/PilA|uniref:Flp family type IVb pilin n=1 Tax=Ralstonia condita TaxID=3058600 RepID=A0ABM9JDA0_9RALS|nr:Flp family type IVb pilin [Ralstonia sp. LMG 7141]MDE2202870.1 Flp family type IVb pilin [Burkholderiaceae bacterium]CAJ0789732.1 hypothetical protein LMG7141_02271 [Ralstonia sp. LMG 7141]